MLLVFLAGVLAGFVNVLAGGGSMLTLPALTLAGIPLSVANGTNRIGILLQNIVAVSTFRKGGVLNLKEAISLSISTLAGALLGSNIAVSLNEEILKRIVGAIFLIVGFLMFRRPKLKRKDTSEWKVHLALFFVGIYGGFIQAGVGFFLMTVLVMLKGYDLVKTNAVKVFVVLVYTVPSLVVFALSGKVDLLPGLVLGAGTMLGGYIGTKMAILKGSDFIKYVVLIMVVLSAVKFLFF